MPLVKSKNFKTSITLFVLAGLVFTSPSGPVPAWAAAKQPAITTGTLTPQAEFRLSPEDRDYLMDVYKDTWRYISTFVEPATGLPYDSDARQPATSVSNVGLYLTSTIIAFRTGLIAREEALARVNLVLDSLNQMEKWEGFPRVWFSSRTLKPTYGIDTFSYSKHLANLVGGLVMAQQTFPDELNQTIGGLLREMRFNHLYDARTGWLKGGYNAATKNFAVAQPFGNWYNKFFAYEGRLLSFYMVARGLVPEKHWSSLTRPIQQKDGVWFFVPGYEDGGAYMPYLASIFIDESKTLMGFSQKNYSQSQMTHADKIGAPVWGWSSSLDTRGEYIAYGELRDEIVAPHASILAINHYPAKVIENLKALEKLGARPVVEEVPVPVLPEKSSVPSPAAATPAGDVVESATPWALIDSTDVYFTNREGKTEKISGWIDPAQKEGSINSFDEAAFLKLVEAIGYTQTPGDPLKKITSGISSPTVLKSGLKESLLEGARLGDLLGLASRLGIYTPSKIYFTNGRTARVILSPSQNGTLKPWALIFDREVYFLDKDNKAQKFSAYIESPSADGPKKIGQYDNAALTQLVDAPSAGKKLDAPKSSTPVETLFQGTALKSELAQSLSPDTPLEDLLALATDAGLYVPGQVKYSPDFKSGVTVPAAFLFESKPVAAPALPQTPAVASQPAASLEQPTESAVTDSAKTAPTATAAEVSKSVKPWAILDALEVFFLNRDGKMEKLSDYVDSTPAYNASTKYDTTAFEQIAPALGYEQTAGQSFGSLISNIRVGSSVKPGFLEALPDSSLSGELLGMGAKALLYIPCRLVLKDGKTFSCLATTGADGAQKLWAVESNGEVFFMNNENVVAKLSAYLAVSSQPGSIQNYDQVALSQLVQAMGFSVNDSAKVSEWVKALNYGTEVKPEIWQVVDNPLQVGELLGLASKNGLYEPGQIHFTGGMTAAASYLSSGKALWAPPAPVATEPALTESKDEDIDPAMVVPIPDEAFPSEEDVQKGMSASTEVPLEEGPKAKPVTYGFRDSVDWKKGEVAPHYLMPSQGMAFLSLANFLFDGIVWKTFNENPKMKAASEKLLQDASAEAKQFSEQASGQCLLDISAKQFQPKNP